MQIRACPPLSGSSIVERPSVKRQDAGASPAPTAILIEMRIVVHPSAAFMPAEYISRAPIVRAREEGSKLQRAETQTRGQNHECHRSDDCLVRGGCSRVHRTE